LQIDLRVLRFDPERDAAPHWERYTVESEPMDRVLDLLHRVKWETDGALTFRRSCAHGVCGCGRDAHQRPQPAGVQDPRRPARPQDLRRAFCPGCP